MAYVFRADIKVKEQSIENLIKGRKIFEPPRYMTVAQCCQQLMEVEESKQGGFCTPDSLAVGLARVGCDDQLICSGTLAELATVDFGGPLHSLVMVGTTDEIEVDMLKLNQVGADTPRLKQAAEGKREEAVACT